MYSIIFHPVSTHKGIHNNIQVMLPQVSLSCHHFVKRWGNNVSVL